MFNEWFENSDKKFMFMYYQEDTQLYKFNVKATGEIVKYKVIKDGKESEEKEVLVKQDKCPNMAYRFYLIMIILGKEFEKISIGNVQLIKDEGFEDEKAELIEEEKQKALKQIATEMVRKKEEDQIELRQREKEIREAKE